MNYYKFKYNEKVWFECNKWFWFQMLFLLISIPGCDNKSLTTSTWPLEAAKISGVLLNVRVKYFQFMPKKSYFGKFFKTFSN